MSKSTLKPTDEESASIWKKADGVSEGVFDEHALCIAQDQLSQRGFSVVRKQNGRQVVAEILDEELAVRAFLQADLLLINLRRAVFAVGDVKIEGTPG